MSLTSLSCGIQAQSFATIEHACWLVACYEGEFVLGYWVWDVLDGFRDREYASINLDLIDLGLGSYLNDGKFVSVVLAPDVYCLAENDFRIDQAKLTVSTPEPATMILLGLGIIGIAGVRRFRKQN